MKYGLTISDQVSHFMFAVGFGFLLGIFYRVAASIRKMISRKKAAIITQDILFCVISTALCFVFMLVYSDGEIRPDLIAAMGVGALIYFLTLDKPVAAVLAPLTGAIKKLTLLVLKPFALVGSAVKKFAVGIGKAVLNLKNLLKKAKKADRKGEKNEETNTKRKKMKTARKKSRKKERQSPAAAD